MNQEKIVEISEKLLSRLLEFKNNNQGFTFSLRQRDSPQAKKVKRLEKGQWFQGSDYIYLPLFRKGDSARKIKTIGFVIGNNNNEPTNYIEISFKKGNFSDKEIEFYKELADFFKISLNKENYGYYYFKNVDKFLDENLEFYLITFRNKALELLNKYELTDQYVISENEFQKNLKRITIIKDNNILKVIPTQQNMINDNNMNPISLNQILYGPPGTGKTYNTINRALQIIENKSLIELESEERDALKQRFDHYSNNGQIMFTTFHQSMSYEDFIEGIKPEIEEDEEGRKSVIYEVKKGIFKQIAEEARKIRYQSEETSKQYTFDDAWDDLVSEAYEYLEKEESLILNIQTVGMGLKVVDISEKGNLKVQPKSSKEAKIYTVSFSRAKKLQEAFPDLSVIKNIDKEFRAVIGGSNSTAYWAVLNYINNRINSQTTTTQLEIPLAPKPYVLIIDEINRGNVSQIFGELITLIEEDKRLGKNEALEVILPYSKEKFGVPSNLHIIGTMNTADRSVEALDTALRRRFSFVEMMPEYESLNKIQFDDFHLGELLKTINSRIEALLDRDHTIGHSYFINIKPNDTEALKEAFANKIIPLLQEYFYHDYEKIALILGEGFVECIEPKESKVEFARWNGKTLEKPETSRLFKIKKLDDNFNILDSIKHLLNRVAI
jgi:5-methylcytosine-specific restriction protein B